MKDLVRYIASLSLAFLITVCAQQETGNNTPVSLLKTGADILLEQKSELLKGKKIAVVANHTSLLSNGTHLVDTLLNLKEVSLKTVFSPEHGYKGKASAGELIDEVKPQKEFKIVSLYGKKKKPEYDDLKDIDLVIFDIQDIGVRFYTYISTLYYVVEACEKYDKELVVLDRPNPIGNFGCSGQSTGKDFISFISVAPIPVMHGMTIGELALLFNNEYLSGKAKISIIKMENWLREKVWNNYNLQWIKPSPNIPDYETALLYPMNCFIEGLNISEGRGTYEPFKIIGAPFIDSQKLISELKKVNLSGVEITETSFTPKKIEDMSKYPKYEDELCNGIRFKITDPKSYTPLVNAVKLLKTLVKTFPEKIKFREKHFDLLWGNDSLRNLLTDKTFDKIDAEKIVAPDSSFIKLRKKYLLY